MPFLGSLLPQGRCWPTAFLNLGLGATLFLFPHPRLLDSSLGAQLFCPPSLQNLTLGAISDFDPHSEIKNVFQNPSKTYSAVPVPVILLVCPMHTFRGAHESAHWGTGWPGPRSVAPQGGSGAELGWPVGEWDLGRELGGLGAELRGQSARPDGIKQGKICWNPFTAQISQNTF